MSWPGVGGLDMPSCVGRDSLISSPERLVRLFALDPRGVPYWEDAGLDSNAHPGEENAPSTLKISKDKGPRWLTE